MPTLKHRALAIVMGSLSTLCAAYLLFGGLPSWEDINGKTVVSAMVLAIAVASCHQFMSACINRRWLQIAPMAILALASTWLVVVGTAGRNSETIKAADEAAQRSQAEYTRAVKAVTDAQAFRKAADDLRKATIEKANADVDKQRLRVADVCNKNPDTDRCRGSKATLATFEAAAKRTAADTTVVEVADSAVKQRESDANKLKPAPDTSPAKAFAVLLATFGLVSSVDATAGVISAVMPYVQSLVIEFAAAWFLLIGFPPAPHVEVIAPTKVAAPANTDWTGAPISLTPAESSLPYVRSEPLRLSIPFHQGAMAASIALPAMFAQPMPVTIAAPVEVAAPVAADTWSDGACHLFVTLADAGRAMTVTEAAEAMGVSVGEASRRKDELGAKLETRRDGRNVFMSIA